MRLPVRIFSDLHLGHKASRITEVESLRPLVEGAGTVLFNGDTWEELAAPWRERSAAMLADLRRICAEEGSDAVFLRGNHDPGWEGPAWIALAGGRIVITHGDALLRESSPWKREIISATDQVEAIWKSYPGAETDLEKRLAVAREIALRHRSARYPSGRNLLSRITDAVLPPQRALRMLDAWIHFGRYGAEFCDTYFPDAEILVTGHFHRTALLSKDRKIIVNTGSFVTPAHSLCAEWDGDRFTVRRIRRTGGSYILAGKTKLTKLFKKY